METLDLYLPERTSPIARDLKLNLKRLVEDGALSPEEAHLALLSVASSVQERTLSQYARDRLAKLGVPGEQIEEAAESAAMMGMLNLYYRFRHMIHEGQGEAAVESYKTAGLRMTALARPVLGKERFEMLALAISVVNGCESCINAHEATLRQAGVEPQKIHDLAKLAAVVNGLRTLTSL